ncbi:MAG: hypothetical protein AB8B57_06005 [Congregibacter sp.]
MKSSPMKSSLSAVVLGALLVSQGTLAGSTPTPTAVTAVPVDSPWVISGLVLALAVVGARLLKNRRK